MLFFGTSRSAISRLPLAIVATAALVAGLFVPAADAQASAGLGGGGHAANTAQASAATKKSSTKSTAKKSTKKASSTAKSTKPAPPKNLNKAQVKNARAIIAVGKKHRVPNRAIEISLMTALQESSLKNLKGGMGDSLGLFQQRPSMGWGSKKKIRDVSFSTRSFLGINPKMRKNKGLLQIKGWKKMSKGKAAQKVQRSAHPHAYSKWEKTAKKMLAAY